MIRSRNSAGAFGANQGAQHMIEDVARDAFINRAVKIR